MTSIVIGGMALAAYFSASRIACADFETHRNAHQAPSNWIEALYMFAEALRLAQIWRMVVVASVYWTLFGVFPLEAERLPRGWLACCSCCVTFLPDADTLIVNLLGSGELVTFYWA
jgi:hypothetical protein